MHTKQELRPEEVTLDPADWGAFGRALAAKVEETCAWLGGLRERAPWRPVPPEVRARLDAPLPRRGEGLEATWQDFREDVLPYPWGNIHPRFWGWVNGSGVPSALLADLAASAMNSNVASFDQSGVLVERTVLRWLREMLGYPIGEGDEGDGLLTSGGSMANLLGLAAARTAKAPFDVRKRGLAGTRFTLYASTETHSSVTKAVEVLGFGSDALRRVPVDADYRVDVAALARAVADDRTAGFRPLCVIGNAGTVNNGATDDLAALAELCRNEDLWLHVDGAFGALAWLCPEERGALRGLQEADSLAFDLHKWLFLPSDAGCVLVRDPDALTDAFAVTASYLTPVQGGLAADIVAPFKDRGLELTRRFRALKAWFALKEHGLETFEGLVRRNLAQARLLARRVEEEPELELCAPAPLNVVCFRYHAGGFSEEALDALNRELLVRVQHAGAVPSHTVIGGRFALRAAITNHRTRDEDVEFLVSETLRLGRSLANEARAEGRAALTP